MIWEYRAYDAKRNICEGKEKANSFSELALMLRQRGLQVLEATKLNEESTLAAIRLAKMRARISPPDEEILEKMEKPAESAIRRFFSQIIPPFLNRSNDSTKLDPNL